MNGYLCVFFSSYTFEVSLVIFSLNSHVNLLRTICCFPPLILLSPGNYARLGFDTFDSFYFLTFFTFCCMILCGPLWLFFEFTIHRTRRCLLGDHLPFSSDYYAELADDDSVDHHVDPSADAASPKPPTKRSMLAVVESFESYYSYVMEQVAVNPMYSPSRYARVSLLLCLINFFSSYVWYMSLEALPVSINSSLFRSCDIVFVYIFSHILLGEKYSHLKTLSLFLCLGGVVMVGLGNFNDSHDSAGTLRGYVLVIVAALSWVAYEISYSRLVGNANTHGVMVINTMMGAWSLMLLWIPFLILYYNGVETVPELTYSNIEFLLANAVFAVSYYLLYALAIIICSPLYVSLCGYVLSCFSSLSLVSLSLFLSFIISLCDHSPIYSRLIIYLYVSPLHNLFFLFSDLWVSLLRASWTILDTTAISVQSPYPVWGSSSQVSSS